MGFASAELCDRMGVSRSFLASLGGKEALPHRIAESFYSFAYQNGFRLNLAREEILREENTAKLLFHGSASGLTEIKADGSRPNCDFGSGFYLGETYEQAASFVCDALEGSVYSFSFDATGLKSAELGTDLDWMILICFSRGRLKSYADHRKMKALLEKNKGADYLIAPIANNRMFRVMKDFATGEMEGIALNRGRFGPIGLAITALTGETPIFETVFIQTEEVIGLLVDPRGEETKKPAIRKANCL